MIFANTFEAIRSVFISRQFFFFLLFGGSAALVNLGVGWLLYGGWAAIHMRYEWGVVVGASAGLLVNFTLNYRFNFRFQGRSAMAQLRTFTAVSVIGILLTEAISSFLNNHFPIPLVRLGPVSVSRAFAAHFTAVGLVTFYSFVAHRYLTFNVGLRGRGKQWLSKRAG